uniref:BPTI/Kunitz inhibitor domain-containing protein n=1 Tax=Podarcis muralis TaxID=64176 RepID=A0A670KA73_PODMU
VVSHSHQMCKICLLALFTAHLTSRSTTDIQDPPPKCKQPLILGDCKASKRRYYYDAERKRCFVFIYSGCGSNGNNFDSFRECYEECEKTEVPGVNRYEPCFCPSLPPPAISDFLRDYCDQPLDVGCCNKDLPRFYYDYSSRTCKEFIYSGCGGNGNNFLDLYQCVFECHPSGKDNFNTPSFPLNLKNNQMFEVKIYLKVALVFLGSVLAFVRTQWESP